MKVIWLGQNGLLFISGKTKVLVDPYLSDSLRQYDNTKVRRWAINKKFLTVEPDVIALTSSRQDHADMETVRHYINDNKQLVTVLCCEGAFKKISSSGFGGRFNKVFMDNSSHWTHENLYFQTVPAYTNESGAFGLIITDAYDGKKYYVTSNTVYTEDIFKYIPKDIDTLFIPISGEAGTMDGEKASLFASRVNAKHNVPLKFGMFDSVSPYSLDVDNLVIPVIYKIIPLEEDGAVYVSHRPAVKSDKEEACVREEETAVEEAEPVVEAEAEETVDYTVEETVGEPVNDHAHTDEVKTEREEKAEEMESIKDTKYIKGNEEKGDTSEKKDFDPFATDKMEGTVEIDSARFAVAFATLDSIGEMSYEDNTVPPAPVTEIKDTDAEIEDTDTETESADEEIVVASYNEEKMENTLDITPVKPSASSDNPFDDPDFDFRKFVYDPNRKKEDVISSIEPKEVKPFVLIDEDAPEELENEPEEIVDEVAEEEACETVDEIVEEAEIEPTYEEAYELSEEAPEENASEESYEEVSHNVEEAEEEDYSDEEEVDDTLFDMEEDCDYDEEFYIKDSEYDLKYAVVQGEFYDEDEDESCELDVIDGNVGDSENEELYSESEETEQSFEQISLVEETEEAEEEAVEEAEEASYEQVSLFEENEENTEDVAEIEETEEEFSEEINEEIKEETEEAPSEEIIEDIAEEPVEEPAEEIVEELVIEETVEESVIEEIIEEKPVEEEIIEEPEIEEEEEPEIEILYDEDGNEICTYDGVVMHYDSDADDEELFGFDVGDDYYDDEPERDSEDVSHIIDAYVKELEKLDNGEDVDFSSIVF